MDVKKNSFEYGALILLFSTALVKIIGAVFKIPLSNLLGDLGFGYFSSVYDLFLPIYTVAMSGLPVALSKTVSTFVSKGDGEGALNSFYISRRIFAVMGTILTLFALLIAYPLCAFTDSSMQSFYGLLLMAPSLLFCCLLSAYRGYFEGHSDMVPTAVSDIILALCKLLLGYSLAFAVMRITKNISFAAAAAIFGITLGTLAAFSYSAISFKKKNKGAKSALSKTKNITVGSVLTVALPITVASLSGSFTTLIDALSVRSIITSGYVSLPFTSLDISTAANALYGIRGKAYTLFNLVPALCTVIGVSAVPEIAALKEKNLKPDINISFKYVCAVAFPAGLGLFALSDKIMPLLYKESQFAFIGPKLLAIYGIAAVFAGISVYLICMLQASGNQKAALVTVIISAMIKFILNVILIGYTNLNICGAAYSTLACYIFTATVSMVLFIKSSGFVPDFLNCIFKPFVSAAVGCTVAYFVAKTGESKLITVAAIVSAAAIFFVLLSLFHTLSREELQNLKIFNLRDRAKKQ